MHSHQKHEPKHVGNHEPLTERNIIIQWAPHGMVYIPGNQLFLGKKAYSEKRPEKQQPQMPEFGRIQIGRPKPAIINQSKAP